MRRYPTYDYGIRPSCDNENQIALAEIKLEIQNLQQLLVGLRQKLDPDFKLEPAGKFLTYMFWIRSFIGMFQII